MSGFANMFSKKCVRKCKLCFLKLFHKKLIVVCAFLSFLALWFIVYIYSSMFAISSVFPMEFFSKYNETELQKIKLGRSCYKLSSNVVKDLKLFDDILESKKKPRPERSIFFHVTTCSTDGSIILNARLVNLIQKFQLIQEKMLNLM